LIINDSKFSFVHVQNNWQLALLVYIKYLYKVDYKIIYTIHGYRHNNYFKAIFAKRIIDLALFFFANIVLTASSEVKQKFWLIKRKCFVLYLGVEESYFNTPEPDYYAIHKNIIFAGQFRKGKNQRLILEAMSKYIERTGNKNFSLYLPGEGPLKGKCIGLAHHLKLVDNVIFPGQLSREDVLNLYTRCQIAIVPTNSETFGHCIAEPFVMGLCVMTRNVGIAVDVIINAENGLIFRDSNDLLLLLEKYLTNDDAISAMGKSAYNNNEQFRWKSICIQYEKIIKTN
jgi:glycosyltransferase involved in cell wall biosynthesis